MKTALQTYYAKRDFAQTPEPREIGPKRAAKRPIFVIQKHQARRLHFDFRLEIDGVMPSWAVPKGPSDNPSVKRLAVQTENHPLSYARFKGSIPAGNYGAGKVEIWDHGTFENATVKDGRPLTMTEALERGHIVIDIQGRKVHGAYALTRIRGKGPKSQWLLIKVRDGYLRASPEAPRDPTAEPPPLSAAMPSWIEPMKATLTDERFSREDWIYEPKLDGVRCLAYKDGAKVTLYSRRRLSLNSTYPEIVEALRKQRTKRLILDGEIVAFQPNSTVSSFALLQQRLGVHSAGDPRQSKVPVYYYVFDLPYAEGRDWRSRPVQDRKAELERRVQFNDQIRFTSHIAGHGEALYQAACHKGWEGLIVKRLGSPYVTGRSENWLKFKCVLEQEFVIGGYTDPQGARKHFGALLIGYYEKGELRFAGKVGTGFDEKGLERVAAALKKLEQSKTSFTNAKISLRGVHWVEPKLVAQIGFGEWTVDGKLRQPRFIGIRADKDPREVTRERPRKLSEG